VAPPGLLLLLTLLYRALDTLELQADPLRRMQTLPPPPFISRGRGWLKSLRLGVYSWGVVISPLLTLGAGFGLVSLGVGTAPPSAREPVRGLAAAATALGVPVAQVLFVFGAWATVYRT
jgi:hypothetical protein